MGRRCFASSRRQLSFRWRGGPFTRGGDFPVLFRCRNFPSLLGCGIWSHLLALLRSLRSALLRSPLFGLLIRALLLPAGGRGNLLALLLLALDLRLSLLLLLLQIALLLLVVSLLFLEVALLFLITLLLLLIIAFLFPAGRRRSLLTLLLQIALLFLVTLLLLLLIITLLFPAGWRGSLLALLLQIALLLLVISLLLLKVALLFLVTLLLLLIIAVLFPASWRGLALVFAAALSLAALFAIHIFRATFLLDHFANRTRGESLASGALDGVHARAPIHIDSLLAAVEINRLTLEVPDYVSAADDPRVIPDEIMPVMKVMVKIMNVAKHKERRRQHSASRTARSPADVIIAVAPGDPCRGPIRSRNPDPADTRVIIPRPVMIAGPRPRFVAVPIPAGVGPFPISDGVRLPIHAHLRWMPAAAIGADIYPGAVWLKGRVKIRRSVDLYPRREFHIGASRAWTGCNHRGASHENDCQALFHIKSFLCDVD